MTATNMCSNFVSFRSSPPLTVIGGERELRVMQPTPFPTYYSQVNHNQITAFVSEESGVGVTSVSQCGNEPYSHTSLESTQNKQHSGMKATCIEEKGKSYGVTE